MDHPAAIQADNSLQKILASPIGEMVTRSWMEYPVLSMLEHWFFPLSRLWAAARRANGDVDAFFAAVPMQEQGKLRGEVQELLDKFTIKREQILQTEQHWQRKFFNPETQLTASLELLEQQRIAHRTEYNNTRQSFRKLRRYVKTSVYNNFSSPEDLERIYGTDDAGFEACFQPPAKLPEVAISQPISSSYGRDYWLRFTSPAARIGDQVYARVLEPAGVKNPPTLIFGHGIGVEFDHWRNLVDVVKFFPQLGIRVIRPEAPWHGRRVPDGYYGGEYFLSRTPMGAFDFFTAQHQEWAVLMNWARATSSGPLAIGGSSLGAQSAQMTAIRSQHWDARYQPDALFLMTHCTHLWEVALDGALADIWGLHEPLRASGWTRRLMEQWLQRLDPAGVPNVDPDRIISVLGRSDAVTPYHSGKRLQELWDLPEENCFHFPGGHFSVPLRMARHHRPIQRFRTILSQI